MSQITVEMIKEAGQRLEKEHTARKTLEKQAAFRSKAEQLAFRQVESGYCAPFRSFEEFEEKVASLLKEDLEVVEKAMDLGIGNQLGVGNLATDRGGKTDSEQNLVNFIMTGETS